MAEESFDFCSNFCLDKARIGTELMKSTADRDFCAICGNYGREFSNKTFNVKSIEQEECDCIEKHGRILHNNGGNYHISTYKIIK